MFPSPASPPAPAAPKNRATSYREAKTLTSPPSACYPIHGLQESDSLKGVTKPGPGGIAKATSIGSSPGASLLPANSAYFVRPKQTKHMSSTCGALPRNNFPSSIIAAPQTLASAPYF